MAKGYGRERGESKMESHGEKRRGVAEKTVPNNYESDSGSKQSDLCRVAERLNSNRGGGIKMR